MKQTLAASVVTACILICCPAVAVAELAPPPPEFTEEFAALSSASAAEQAKVKGWVKTVLDSAASKGRAAKETREVIAKMVAIYGRPVDEEEEPAGGVWYQEPAVDVAFALADYCLGREDQLTKQCFAKLRAHPVLIENFQQAYGPASEPALRMMMSLADHSRLPENIVKHASAAFALAARSPLYRHPSSRVSATKLALIWRAPLAKQDFLLSTSDMALFEEQLKVARAKLGADHPETLAAADRLALCLSVAKDGNVAAAEGYLRNIMEARVKALGATHADTLTSIDNLGWHLYTEGNLESAAPLLRQAHSGRITTLGVAHEDTVLSQEHLAALSDSLGDRAEAQAGFEAVLAAREASLGPNHQLTLKSLVNLADFHLANGDLTLAEPLFQAALTRREAALGPAHLDTLSSFDDLGELCFLQKDYPAAKEWFTKANEGRRGRGFQLRASSVTLAYLGMLHYQQGNFKAAESVMMSAHGASGTYQSNGGLRLHPASARIGYWRALADQAAGHTDAALRELRDAVEDLTKFLGAAHPWTVEASTLQTKLKP
ncbi:MAG: tetratricopeptide repeat protein [Verrucomicrobiales bacterium]